MKKIPKLRFKEFTEEWEEKRLGEIFKFSQGLQVDIENQFLIKTSTRERFIRIIDITQKINEIRYVEKISNNYMVNIDDIFIVRYGASVGTIGFGYHGIIANNLFKLIKLDENIFSKFFYFQFNTEKFKNNLLQTSSSTSMPALNFKGINKINVCLSTLQEQEKIADFLSSVDKKISLTEEKLELFKNYKKGIMQKIFSQKLRFKDENGNDYPEWEEKKLGDISKLIDGDRGKNYPSEKDIKKAGKLFLSTSNFFNNRLVFNKNDKFISEDKFNQLIKGQVIKEDLIITLRGSIGNVVLFENNFYETAFINAQMMIIRPIKINKYFLYFLLLTSKNQRLLNNMSSGSAQPQLTKKDLNNFLLKIPNFKEQEKIANFLSSIDEKIEKIENKLENLKEFKKGLLQQMFI